MVTKNKPPKYPENKYLAHEVFKSDLTTSELAKKVGCSRKIISEIINGHYKGVNIIPRIKAELGI